VITRMLVSPLLRVVVFVVCVGGVVCILTFFSHFADLYLAYGYRKKWKFLMVTTTTIKTTIYPTIITLQSPATYTLKYVRDFLLQKLKHFILNCVY
jgi:hypothetical protein